MLKSKAYEVLRKIHTVVERAVYWKRERWGYLVFFYAYILYRIFTY